MERTRPSTDGITDLDEVRRASTCRHQARFDLETAEDVLAPQIKKIASYKAA